MKEKNVIKKPIILAILDGFGLSDQKYGNAITPETAPFIFSCLKEYPSTTLYAHGEHVGLFPGQEGNSEAGHLNIGAGRIVKQDLVRISEAIEDGTFYKNEAFKQALFHVQKYNTSVHIMGLLTDNGSAHARAEHLYALIEYFRRHEHKKVFLHLFTDGRDSEPYSALSFLSELEKRLLPHEKIASICGRFYAMDRDNQWERTGLAYNAIVAGKGEYTARSAKEAIEMAYNRDQTDEYISPTIIVDEKNEPLATVSDNDAIYFFNTRSDRARQLTKSFVQKDFCEKNPDCFDRYTYPDNIRFVAMTDFGSDLEGVFTAFSSPDLVNTLPCVLGKYHKKQLYISESEKYAHVTYFFNGGAMNCISNEDQEIIASSGEYSYADRPQMEIERIVNTIVQYLDENIYDFICVNFPNADMVGHTGNYEAARTAVKVIDTAMKVLADTIVEKKGILCITADHGNAEKMIEKNPDRIVTEHTTNLVPFILVQNILDIKLHPGKLSDIAPTLLALFDIEKPPEMTGETLF